MIMHRRTEGYRVFNVSGSLQYGTEPDSM